MSCVGPLLLIARAFGEVGLTGADVEADKVRRWPLDGGRDAPGAGPAADLTKDR